MTEAIKLSPQACKLLRRLISDGAKNGLKVSRRTKDAARELEQHGFGTWTDDKRLIPTEKATDPRALH